MISTSRPPERPRKLPRPSILRLTREGFVQTGKSKDVRPCDHDRNRLTPQPDWVDTYPGTVFPGGIHGQAHPCAVRSQSPELARPSTTNTVRHPIPSSSLALAAILNASKDAGIDPHVIDGFASYSNDRSDPSRIAAALGTKELRFSNMQWGRRRRRRGRGRGATRQRRWRPGMADCVVVFRALAQGQFARFGQGPNQPDDLR